MVPQTKKCTKCGETKPIAGFSFNDKQKRYRRSWCKTCMACKGARYREKHIEEIRAYSRAYGKRNRARIVALNRERYFNDPQYRLSCLLRSRLRCALKHNAKRASAVQDLCCSLEQLRYWLEAQFLPGMTWDNCGTAWHIDHIKPLSSFDLTQPDQVKAACHWFNLQPLWARDNISKGAKQ